MIPDLNTSEVIVLLCYVVLIILAKRQLNKLKDEDKDI